MDPSFSQVPSQSTTLVMVTHRNTYPHSLLSESGQLQGGANSEYNETSQKTTRLIAGVWVLQTHPWQNNASM